MKFVIPVDQEASSQEPQRLNSASLHTSRNGKNIDHVTTSQLINLIQFFWFVSLAFRLLTSESELAYPQRFTLWG